MHSRPSNYIPSSEQDNTVHGAFNKISDSFSCLAEEVIASIPYSSHSLPFKVDSSSSSSSNTTTTKKAQEASNKKKACVGPFEHSISTDLHEKSRIRRNQRLIKHFFCELSYTAADVQEAFLADDASFHELQETLRNRGCVTNTYLKQKVHKYICRHKRKQEKQACVSPAANAA